MNNEWNSLSQQFMEKGYSPHDVKRMVLLYEMLKEQDEKLKEKFFQDENEEAPF